MQRPLQPQRQIYEALLNPRGPVLQYAQQLDLLLGAGYALWDVLAQAEVRNSDDTSISKGTSKPNDVRGFLRRYPSVRRVVFGSGMASAKLFVQHHRAWLQRCAGCQDEGIRFVIADDDASRACFRTCVRALPAARDVPSVEVQLIVPPSVSPACARMRYVEKRDRWLELVFNTTS